MRPHAAAHLPLAHIFWQCHLVTVVHVAHVCLIFLFPPPRVSVRDSPIVKDVVEAVDPTAANVPEIRNDHQLSVTLSL